MGSQTFPRSEIEETLVPVGGALVVFQYTTGESSGVGAASLVVNPLVRLTAPHYRPQINQRNVPKRKENNNNLEEVWDIFVPTF